MSAYALLYSSESFYFSTSMQVCQEEAGRYYSENQTIPKVIVRMSLFRILNPFAPNAPFL